MPVISLDRDDPDFYGDPDPRTADDPLALGTTWCTYCGEECSYHVVDEGIGVYEYWGQRGTHVELVPYSDCCNDHATNDPDSVL